MSVDGGHLGIGPTDSMFYDGAYGFPFDIYHLRTSFLTTSHNSSSTDPTSNPILPILKLAPVDTADNFAPTFVNFPTLTDLNGTGTLLPSTSVLLTLRRTPLAKSFNMMIFMLNWLLSAVVVSVAVVTHWSPSEEGQFAEETPDSLVIFPLSVILTIPSLRGLMVGSPQFGMQRFIVSLLLWLDIEDILQQQAF